MGFSENKMYIGWVKKGDGRMRTTEEDFRVFKEEFIKWQKKLGLQGYDIRFEHRRDDKNYATCCVSEAGKSALVTYSMFIREIDKPWHNPKTHARHEALHLLLHRIVYLGQQRYTNSGEILQEWEKLVVILEKVV